MENGAGLPMALRIAQLCRKEHSNWQPISIAMPIL
jgi:hypothetical protein